MPKVVCSCSFTYSVEVDINTFLKWNPEITGTIEVHRFVPDIDLLRYGCGMSPM